LKRGGKLKKVIKVGIIIIIIIVLIILLINFYVKNSTKNQIIEKDDYSTLKNIDCIIILGAGIWGDKPSPMLEDRLKEGILLYNNEVSDKIIMSGDHGREEYDEVNTMKKYAIENGIPSENIFMDHAGFSSYESIYRAKEIFNAKKVVIVTQKYHLYRALYIANQLGLEAYGVGADPRQYVGEIYREAREILARNKDFIKCIFKPEPTYLGDTIPVSGNGDITNDK
jgi:SanA protein